MADKLQHQYSVIITVESLTHSYQSTINQWRNQEIFELVGL